MQRAEYTISRNKELSELKHSALNFELYTHFTSPIRRYPDIVVHRQLKYILNKMNLLKVENNNNNDNDYKEITNTENEKKIPLDDFISEAVSDSNEYNNCTNNTLNESTNLSHSNLFFNFLVKNVLNLLENNSKENNIEAKKSSSEENENKKDDTFEYNFEHIINYEKNIDHFNERYYNGKQISQKCQKLFQYIFLKNLPEQTYKALIVDISNKIPLKNKRNSQPINFETQTLNISLYIPSLNIEIDWNKDDNNNLINFKFNSETSVSIDYKDETDKNVHNIILKVKNIFLYFYL
jgi:hypothetical protein